MSSLNDLMTDLTNIDNAVLAQKSALIEQGIDMEGVPLSQFGSKILEISGGPLEIPVVLSTTKPTPQENMIWVYTNVPSSGRVFTTMLKSDLVGTFTRGDVCIMLGAGNIILNSGELELCPVAVTLYGTAWSSAPAIVYKNGQWQMFYSTEFLNYYSPLNSEASLTVNGQKQTSLSNVTFPTDDTAGVVAEFAKVAGGGILYHQGINGWAPNPTIVFAFKCNAPISNTQVVQFSGSSGGLGSDVTIAFSAVASERIKISSYQAADYKNATTDYFDNQWHTLGVKVSNLANGNRKIELDGLQVNNVNNGSTAPPMFGGRFYIGNGYNNYPFAGRMAHMFVYTNNIPDRYRIGLERVIERVVKGDMPLN